MLVFVLVLSPPQVTHGDDVGVGEGEASGDELGLGVGLGKGDGEDDGDELGLGVGVGEWFT